MRAEPLAHFIIRVFTPRNFDEQHNSRHYSSQNFFRWSYCMNYGSAVKYRKHFVLRWKSVGSQRACLSESNIYWCVVVELADFRDEVSAYFVQLNVVCYALCDGTQLFLEATFLPRHAMLHYTTLHYITLQSGVTGFAPRSPASERFFALLTTWRIQRHLRPSCLDGVGINPIYATSGRRTGSRNNVRVLKPRTGTRIATYLFQNSFFPRLRWNGFIMKSSVIWALVLLQTELSPK